MLSLALLQVLSLLQRDFISASEYLFLFLYRLQEPPWKWVTFGWWASSEKVASFVVFITCQHFALATSLLWSIILVINGIGQLSNAFHERFPKLSGWQGYTQRFTNSRVPAVDPSVVPGTCYSLYLDRHETETAAHSLARQSEPYHEQLCNGTGLSYLSCMSPFTLLVTMVWWKSRRVKNFTRILECKGKVTHTKWAPESFALCVQLLCHPVMLSNFTHLFSCVSYFLWITFFYFVLLHFHYTLLGKSSS